MSKELMEQEAVEIYNLYIAGRLREHYFNEKNNAVLVLECECKVQAQELLEKLPLMKSKLIAFEVMELRPYNGYDRIISKLSKNI